MRANLCELLLFHFDKERLWVERHVDGSIGPIKIALKKELVASKRKQITLLEVLFDISFNDRIDGMGVKEGEYKENVVGSEGIEV